MKLGEKEHRALKILRDRELHEDDKYPLDTITPLVRIGFAQYLPFEKVYERGIYFNVRKIIITQKGRDFLDKELR